jgi:hypothetical protein
MATVTAEELLEAMPLDAILQFYEEVGLKETQDEYAHECSSAAVAPARVLPTLSSSSGCGSVDVRFRHVCIPGNTSACCAAFRCHPIF